MKKGKGIRTGIAGICFLAGCTGLLTLTAGADQYLVAPVRASSTLEGGNYGVENLQDYNPATAWVEGVSGDGIGESLTYTFPAGTVLTGGTICPGYHKSEDLLQKNGAPSSLQISTGGHTVMLDLTQALGSYYGNGGSYDFWLYEPLVSDGEVTVSIEGVRKGWKYEDTCISELRFFGSVPTGPVGNTGQTGQLPGSQAGTQLTLSEAELYRLSGMACWVCRQQTGYDTVYDCTINAGDLTASQQAFILYWYQYNCNDDRILRGQGAYQTDHAVNRALLAIIAGELFPGSLNGNMMTEFYNQYVSYIEGDTIYMNGTGDFGDAGYYYFETPDEVQQENGHVRVTGRVMVWNDYAQSYIHEYMYTASYTVNEPSYEFAPQSFGFEQVSIWM